jgi:hypothetical protein
VRRSKSGSLAWRRCAGPRRGCGGAPPERLTKLILEIDVGERLPVGVADALKDRRRADTYGGRGDVIFVTAWALPDSHPVSNGG